MKEEAEDDDERNLLKGGCRDLRDNEALGVLSIFYFFSIDFDYLLLGMFVGLSERCGVCDVQVMIMTVGHFLFSFRYSLFL